MGTHASSIWAAQLVTSLERFGPQAAEALRYIQQRGTRVSVHAQPTGARWTLDRRIEIHPHFASLPPDDPYALSLIVHEVRHLQQGFFTALSVHGELDAWQLQFGLLKTWTSHYHADAHKNEVLEHIMSLPLGWDRSALEDARRLMQAYAGMQYRVDLLPLYPLPAEIMHLFSGKVPAGNS
jgi:hypothetical protein